MAADPFRIPRDVRERMTESSNTLTDTHADLQELSTVLDTLVATTRDAWEGRSERWQEGDRGEAASTWVETLEELQSTVDELAGQLEELATSLRETSDSPDY